MSYPVSIEAAGQMVTGSYTVQGNRIITVSTGDAFKIALLPAGKDAEALAKFILRELVNEAKT